MRKQLARKPKPILGPGAVKKVEEWTGRLYDMLAHDGLFPEIRGRGAPSRSSFLARQLAHAHSGGRPLYDLGRELVTLLDGADYAAKLPRRELERRARRYVKAGRLVLRRERRETRDRSNPRKVIAHWLSPEESRKRFQRGLSATLLAFIKEQRRVKSELPRAVRRHRRSSS